MNINRTVVTLTGPSCSGKSTLARNLQKHGIPEIRSFTTRAKRGEDDDGYDFLTREYAESLLDGEVVERIEHSGNIYGVTVSAAQAAFANGEKVACVVVDPNGVSAWKRAASALDLNICSIYLDVDIATLQTRFIATRMLNAGDNLDYELRRFQHMRDVEVPTWRDAHNYDLVIKDYGEGYTSELKDYTSINMIWGYLKLTFGL